MSDLISRQAAIDAAIKNDGDLDAQTNAIDKLPSADRPTGTWIEMGKNEDGTHNVKCNLCDNGYKMRGHARSIATKYKYRFCPHCGAKMKGETK